MIGHSINAFTSISEVIQKNYELDEQTVILTSTLVFISSFFMNFINVFFLEKLGIRYCNLFFGFFFTLGSFLHCFIN